MSSPLCLEKCSITPFTLFTFQRQKKCGGKKSCNARWFPLQSNCTEGTKQVRSILVLPWGSLPLNRERKNSLISGYSLFSVWYAQLSPFFLYSSGQAGAFQIGRYNQSLPRSIVKSLRISACYDSEQLLRMLSQSVLEDEVCSQLRPCPCICINIPSEWVSSLAVSIQCLNFSTKWHLWVLRAFLQPKYFNKNN